MARRNAPGVSSLLRSEIAEEAAGKAVARAGGIDDFFERQRRRAEGGRADFLGRLAEEGSGAVFAVLDDQHARAQAQHGARCLHEIGVAGEHACLGVVDEQDVEALEDLEQRRLVVLDPVIHGVAGDKLRVGRGFAHAPLQDGIDVGEERNSESR